MAHVQLRLTFKVGSERAFMSVMKTRIANGWNATFRVTDGVCTSRFVADDEVAGAKLAAATIKGMAGYRKKWKLTIENAG